MTDYASGERAEVLASAALLVNATDRGMAGKGKLNLDLARLAVVCDIVYTPPVAALLAAAKSRGDVAVNGLGRLLNQARPAVDARSGVMPGICPELIHAVEATFYAVPIPCGAPRFVEQWPRAR